jgi:phosphoglycolate phosphatase
MPMSCYSPCVKKQDIEHVVWDWNGTLVDDVAACIEAINVLLHRRGKQPVSREQYIEIFDFPVKNYYLSLKFDFATEDWDSLAREYHDVYEHMTRHAPLREGILEMLDMMRSHNLPMSILSASETSILERMLDARNIRSYFGRLYGLDNLHASSKLELGKLMMSEIGVSKDKVLLIGDTKHDYEVASELGIGCVLIAGGHQAEHRIAKCGCPVLPKISDLAQFLA